LGSTSAKVKYLSCEPLLGSLANVNFSGIDWIVVGGEHGPKARIMKENWFLEIKNKCFEENIKFFFKQWGGVQKKKNGRLLQGVEYSEMPIM